MPSRHSLAACGRCGELLARSLETILQQLSELMEAGNRSGSYLEAPATSLANY